MTQPVHMLRPCRREPTAPPALCRCRGSPSMRLRSERGARGAGAPPSIARTAAMVLLTIVLTLWAAPAFAAVTVTATWDANTESDIAGYKLSYGTQSGVYTTTLDVGNVTS